MAFSEFDPGACELAGAMVVVGHDRDFVQSIDVGGEIRLD